MQGSLRATDTIYTNTAQLSILRAPTTADGTAYGPGTNGNVLSTNGTSAYWRGVTDNSSSTAVTSSDTNLITGRTLYYAGYVKSSGVTSITIKTTSPLSGGSDTATTSTGTYTLVLADGYGDTKNPYGTKNKNLVLASSATANGAAPSFRALVAADLPTATASARGIASFSTGLSVSSGAVSLNIAKNDTLGGVKPWYSHTSASTGPTTGSNATAITVNAIQTTAGRYYAVEADSNGRLFVNVPWANTLVNYTLGTTTKAYLMASQNAPTSTATARAAHGDTQVYLTATAGQLSAKSYSINDGAATPSEKVFMVWNGTRQSVDFIFN